MADVVIDHVNAQLSSLTGVGTTQDFTITGFGTPTAAIILMGHTGTAAAISANAFPSICLFDGTNVRAMTAMTRDGQGSTVCDTAASSARWISIDTSGNVELSATLSFITDGMRLTCTTYSSPPPYRITVILIKGTANAAVGSIQASTTVSGTVSASPGFRPDLVIACAYESDFGAGDGTPAADYLMGIGVATRETGGIVQRGHSYHEPDALGTSEEYQIISDDYIIPKVHSKLYDISMTATSSTGMTFTTVSKGSTNCYIGYLALKFADNHPELKTTAITTGTGTKAFSGFGGTPTSVLTFSCVCPNMDSETSSGDDVGAQCIGVMDSTGDERACNSFAIEDNAGTTMVNGRYPGVQVDLLQPTVQSATWCQGAYSSYDANGFTLNFATNGIANTIQAFSLALVPGAPPAERIFDCMPGMGIV